MDSGISASTVCWCQQLTEIILIQWTPDLRGWLICCANSAASIWTSQYWVEAISQCTQFRLLSGTFNYLQSAWLSQWCCIDPLRPCTKGNLLYQNCSTGTTCRNVWGKSIIVKQYRINDHSPDAHEPRAVTFELERLSKIQANIIEPIVVIAQAVVHLCLQSFEICTCSVVSRVIYLQACLS